MMIKTNPLSVSKIESLANSLRNKFGISQDSAFPIFDILDELFEKGYFGLQIMDDDDSIFENDMPALYDAISNFIYIKESVLVDLENQEYRANFTLAHELFHYLQNKVLDFKFDTVEKCKTFEDAEWQANEFAGQLLVPTKAIENETDLSELSKKYKVSEECVAVRKLYYKKRLERCCKK